MAVIPEITCRRCGSKYSGLRNRCPKCGAPRVNQPTRVPPTTAAATPQTAASGRAAVNIRWQFIFAGVLVLALLLAVIVLVNSGKKSTPASTGTSPSGAGTGTAAYIAADLPTPSPSPEPTPDASPTPVIDSMAITFLNKTFANHSTTISLPLQLMTTDGESYHLDLDVTTYPASDLPVTWRSTNEKILKVNQRGFVTVMGATPNRTVHAAIFAECGGIEDYVVIYIPPARAGELTENHYDPDTYDADNLELDTMIYATPTPRT